MLALYIVLGIIGAALIWIVVDVIIALSKKPIPDLPEKFLDPGGLSLVYYYLTEPDKIPAGLAVDEKWILDALAPSIEYIENRYDCADFRLMLLFRLYKDCGNKLSENVKALIKKTLLGFRYWMDEPGEDSMCFWSENHQLIFAVCEYLHGQEWPDEIFLNSGMTGREHKAKAIKRVNYWMELRFTYGFSEWLSNNYYAENIAPMANFIQYADDPEAVNRMKMIFDLLWLDIASHSVNQTFVAASSRMYGDNKSSDLHGNRSRASVQAIWGKVDVASLVNTRSPIEKSILEGANDVETTIKLVGIDAQMMQNFIAMYRAGYYKLPHAIYDLALDPTEQVIKCSQGLTPAEMAKEGLIGQDDRQIMFQMGAETFTNPEVIKNSFAYFDRAKMYRNLFISPFRFFDIKLLRLLNIPTLLAKKVNLMTHGIALGHGNIYCYRNRYYALTTAVAQNVDGCGAQGHIWTANIAPDLTLYTTQPARDDDGPAKHGASPGYWVGNGRQPMSVQDKNINITIYKIPEKKRLLEFHISDITHAFVPREKYDELLFEGNTMFGRRGKVLVAMIASGKPAYRPYDNYAASLLIQHDKQVEKLPDLNLENEFDLVMQGKGHHCYITELSDTDKESFDAFKARIRSNKVEMANGSVRYQSGGRELYVTYGGVFEIDNTAQPLQYKRYECAYTEIENKPSEIIIAYQGKTLRLDYANNIREES